MIKLNILSAPSVTQSDNIITPELGVQIPADTLVINNPNTAWHFPVMYKRSMAERQLMWVVGYNGQGSIVTRHGQVGGAIQTSYSVVELNKSGKTYQEQALQDTKQKRKEKMDIGYRERGATAPTTINPMLATDLNKTSIKSWPVMVQAKLDGVRAVARDVNGTIDFRSRESNEFKFMQHLRDNIFDFFDFLPEGCALDGELYSHSVPSQLILGMVKSTVNIHPRIDEIEYYIFDLILPGEQKMPYEERYRLLADVYRRYYFDRGVTDLSVIANEPQRHSMVVSELKDLIPVKDIIGVIESYMPIQVKVPKFFLLTSELAFNRNDVEVAHNAYVQMGYEGVMVKKISSFQGRQVFDIKNCIYRFGRCTNLIKYKHFHDDEGIIVGFEEGNGIWLQTPIFVVRDKAGKVFKATPKGSLEKRRKMYSDIKMLIGKRVTYRYQELSQDGIPRFPIALHIRDYE